MVHVSLLLKAIRSLFLATRIFVAALVLFVPLVALGADIFNNTNSGGTNNRPSSQTTFNTPGSIHVTELVTYHWNNGLGARPGSIGLKSPGGQMYGPYPANGSSGQGGAPNVNWSATVNITIPPGTYEVVDSDPNTWSQNAQSKGSGFAIVRGDYVAGAPPPSSLGGGKIPIPPTVQPVILPAMKPPVVPPATKPPVVSPPLPVAAAPFTPCFVNSGSIAASSPCNGTSGTVITIRLSRAIKNPLRSVTFRPYSVRGIAGATGAAVLAPLSGGGTAAGSIYTVSAPPQICLGGGGSWDIFPTDTNGTAQGDIGRFNVNCAQGAASSGGANPALPPVPKPAPPSPPPATSSAPFTPCFVNAGSIASSSPCNGISGTVITIRLSRAIKNPLRSVTFRPYSVRGIAGATGAAVLAPLSGSGTAAGSIYTVSAPPQICLGGNGSWDIFPTDTNGIARGDIGRFNVQCH